MAKKKRKPASRRPSKKKPVTRVSGKTERPTKKNAAVAISKKKKVLKPVAKSPPKKRSKLTGLTPAKLFELETSSKAPGRPFSGDVKSAIAAQLARHRPRRRRLGVAGIGVAKRSAVSPTQQAQAPWSAVCCLISTFRSGPPELGTGWFAGPRLIITAGHCVFNKRNGRGKALRIDVFPCRNGDNKPLSRMSSATVDSTVQWINSPRDQGFEFDFGAVILQGPLPANWGSKISPLAYKSLPDSELKKGTATIGGYPGDKNPVPSLWSASHALNSMNQTTLFYQIDTAGGESGSPVMMDTDSSGKNVVVGIHNNEFTTNMNCATRITKDVVDLIDAWNDFAGT